MSAPATGKAAPPPLSPPVRGAWRIAVVAALPLVVDIAYPSVITGIVATGAMALFCGIGWRSLRGLRMARRAQMVLLLGLTGFLVARAVLLARQLGPGSARAMGEAAASYDLAFFGLEGAHLLVVTAQRRVQRLGILLLQRPALMLTASFAGLIVIGTFLLSMPFAVHETDDISLLDSLFTATSAVCVTGLAVNVLGVTYTGFGEVVIVLLMQAGGIGIMTISALALRLTTDLETQARYASMLEARNFTEMRALVRNIVVMTVVIEGIGALFLCVFWWDDPLVAAQGGAVWNAIFHSVSAFTNTGFSLFPNLGPWRGHAGIQLVLMSSVILGGVGFAVMREVLARLRARVRHWRGEELDPRRLSAGSRIAIVVSAVLIGGGAVLFAVLESTNAGVDLSLAEHILSSLFASVCARTAGFQTLDFGLLLPSTLLVVMVLMFVGGSPGSCAGGIKTTTAAVLVSSLNAELRGREPGMFGRAIAASALRRAIAVTTISTGVVLCSLVLLTLTETHSFLELVFETVSAYATCGYSTGITPTLSAAGKLIIVATMFIGRVGPLTIALAMADRRERARHRLAPEELPIG